MLVDDRALAKQICVERFQIVAGSWSNSFLGLFFTFIRVVKVISDRTRILCSFPRAKSSDKSPSFICLSWNSRITNTSVNGFCKIIWARSDIMLGMRFDKVVFPLGFTVLPLDRTPWWLHDSPTRIGHVVWAWSQSTAVVCESCYFGDKYTFNVGIAVDVRSETSILNIWIRAFFVLKIKLEHRCQESWWYRRNRDVVKLKFMKLLHRVVHVGRRGCSYGVGGWETKVSLWLLIKHHLFSHLLANYWGNICLIRAGSWRRLDLCLAHFSSIWWCHLISSFVCYLRVKLFFLVEMTIVKS